MKTIHLPDGTEIPAVGQGTWYLGEERSKRTSETQTLRWGVEHGLTLIDTAEMYGDGASEGWWATPLNRSTGVSCFWSARSTRGMPDGETFLIPVRTALTGWERTIWTCICSIGAAVSR